MKRGEPPKRKTPLARGTKPLKRTPIKRTAVKRSVTTPLKPASTLRRRPTPPDPLTPVIRAAVAQRSGGRCEVGAVRLCTGHGEHVHHRKLRRFGDHRPVNLLHVCMFCHESIHANVPRSYAMGWLLRGTDNPDEVDPVLVA